MPKFRSGHVTKLISERPGLQRVEVDDEPTYVLTQLVGSVLVGDEVIINTTAVDLNLGTGGWHVLHWNLSRREFSEPGPGHIMKLRYTSNQLDTGAAEEELGLGDSVSLEGKPIVLLPLHSLLAPVVATIKHLRPEAKVAYVMTDAASLPIALSDLVHDLKSAGFLDLTLTSGQAFGGDLECVNAASAMHVASQKADIVVIGMGPGNVGTGSTLGFAGLEVASLGDLAIGLGGRAIACLRWSDRDERARHNGLSHHLTTALRLAGQSFEIAVPLSDRTAAIQVALAQYELNQLHEVKVVEPPDVVELLKVAGIGVTSMGRSLESDRLFAQMAAAAGTLAAAAIPSS